MSNKKGELSIGHRAFELISAKGNVSKETREIGISKSKAYDWANGLCPSARSLQAMALAGYDVMYILTGRRANNA